MATIKLIINEEIVEIEKDLALQGIEAGEVKIESDKLIVKSEDSIIYTKDEHETYTANVKKAEYEATKEKANEMAMKAIKNASGLEFDGYKDPATFATTFKAKIIEDAKIEPTKKIQDLEGDLNTMRGNYETERDAFVTFKTGVTERETRTKKDTLLSSFIPSEGLKVNSKITLMALKTEAGLDIDYDENGKSYITKNGEMVKDNLLQPIEPKTFIESTLKEMDLIKGANGGSGEGDNTGDGKTGGYEAFVKEMEAKGSDHDPGTQNFAVEMNKRIGAKTLVM
jgi:hypothetical protein